MSGMFRLKDDKALQEMLKRSNLRLVGDTAVKASKVMLPPTKIVPSNKPESDIEALFSQQLSLTNLPPPIRNYLYLRGSRHELDFAWPDQMIGVEVQGMAHRIKEKFKTDIKKRAQGLLQGWKILEIDGDHIRDGVGMEWLHQLFELDERSKLNV